MKLDAVARYDRSAIKGDAQVTPEGFVRANAIVTRTGIFNYRNPDGTIRKELRHPDDVLDAISLETMKMIPVTNGHPEERLITAENAKRLAVGFTGETIENDGNNVLAKLVVTDAEAVKDIKEKNRKELSLGYTVDLVPENGSWNGESYEYRQTNIRYNHLSLVDMARAGSVARIVLDSSDAVEVINEELNMAKVKIKIDQEDLEVEKRTAEHYEKLMEDFKNLSQEKERVQAELDMIKSKLAEMEGKSGETDEVEKKTKLPEENRPGPVEEENTPKMDGKTFQEKVKERVKLEKLAETVLDGVDVSDLSDLEIKKKIFYVKNKYINLDGKSNTYIDAAFEIAVGEYKEKPTVKAYPQGTFNRDNKDIPNAIKARDKMIERMQNQKAVK